MKKRALLVTTVSGFIPQFQMHTVKFLQCKGYEVHYASNYNMPFYGEDNSRLDGTSIIRHQIDFARSPYSKQTIIAYKQLKKLMKDNQFDLVHCHTPMGGVLGRLAAKNTHTKPLIYSAHGFHFYKGAPMQNFLIYKTIEKYLAKYTDALVTTNSEDFEAAQKFKMNKGGQAYFIPGVGIDAEKVKSLAVDKEKLKNDLHILEKDFVLLSVGELSKRKNHEIIIKSFANLKDLNIIYLICGHGELENYLKKLVNQLGLEEKVRFLGYQIALPYYHISNVLIHPSYQEGLSRALMEAMAAGLPVICSKIRGNIDLIDDNGGILVETNDVQGYKNAISDLYHNKDMCINMGTYNLKKIKKFDIKTVEKMMESVYLKLMVK